jgi:hypothetical protein
MILRSLIVLLVFILANGQIKHRLLEDGITKVPADENYFTKNYREKFKVAKPDSVETGVLYVESYYIDTNNKWFRTGGTYSQPPSALLFYENGCVNDFSNGKNSKLNPEISGYRGMSFIKKGKKLIEIIAPANEVRSLGKITYEYSTAEDTLFLTRPATNSRYVYIKDKSGRGSTFNPNW